MSSLPKLRRSSTRLTTEGWRKMMLLMVSTGEEALLPHESLSLLARDDVEALRRKDVRRLAAERRAVMDWRREDCMVAVVVVVCGCGGDEEVEWFVELSRVRGCSSRGRQVWGFYEKQEIGLGGRGGVRRCLVMVMKMMLLWPPGTQGTGGKDGR